MLKPLVVTKDNIKTTVVKDGFQTLKRINQGCLKTGGLSRGSFLYSVEYSVQQAARG